MIAGGRKTTGGRAASAPVAAARQAWIFHSTDYRLDPQGLPGLNRESDTDRTGGRRAFWGPAWSRADIAREGEFEWGSIWRTLGLAANLEGP
jgi:hypothetical protein